MHRWRPLLLALGVLAAACGDGDPLGSDPDEGPADPAGVRYTRTGLVLESPSHGPQLCLGGVAESYPPQCGGLDVVGWDWDDVDGEESASGTTWGEYTVVGTYDGEVFTLTEPARRPDPGERPGPVWDRLGTPCPAPAGGWQVVHPATATNPAMEGAIAYARRQPDGAGVWLDQSINPAYGREPVDERAMNDPTKLVLNLSFTGDLERHEAAVRAIWGGALCVSLAPRSADVLDAIRDEVEREVGQVWFSSASPERGHVDIGVTVDDGLQERFDRRYGEGVVVVHPELRPVT